MKKLAICLLVVVPMLASAQNLEELLNRENLQNNLLELGKSIVRHVESGKDKERIRKENDALNASQPALNLKGQRVKVRIVGNELGDSYDIFNNAWLLSDTQRTLTDSRVGASVAFNDEQLAEMTEFFDSVNSNKYVKKATKYGTGKDAELEAPTVQVDVTIRLIRSENNLRGFLGGFFRGLGLEIGNATSYVGKIYAVRPLKGNKAGNVVATYKVIGRASSSDRLAGDFWDRTFGAGFEYEADDEQKRDATAADNSSDQMLAILAQKTREFHDRR